MLITALHDASDHFGQIAAVEAVSVGVKFNYLVFVNNFVDWLNVRRSRATNHFNESSFSVGLDDFVNADLLFLYVQSDILFNLISEFQNGISGDSSQDASIVNRSVSLDLSVPILQNKEHVEDSHFLNEVVKEP